MTKPPEPIITVNGVQLTEAQAMAVRVAVASMRSDLSRPERPEDRPLDAAYDARLAEVERFMFAEPVEPFVVRAMRELRDMITDDLIKYPGSLVIVEPKSMADCIDGILLGKPSTPKDEVEARARREQIVQTMQRGVFTIRICMPKVDRVEKP